MGSGPSRGKKVAPACVSEVNVTQTTAGVTSRKRDCGPFKPLKIHAVLRNARNRAQQDCHSEGPDSDLSGEDDDAAVVDDGEVDTVHADDDESARKPPTKKTFVKSSKTYGLCHFSRADTEDEVSAAEEPRGPRCGARDVNNRSGDAFTHCPTQHSSTSQGFLTRGVLLDAVSTSEKQSTFGSCDSSSLTMPVILYDGSEEELMDTIEREYS
ncbi:hypothetical protein JOB18_043674 [Solea senegalensis]|uniref:Uncharacterized protein n=1 Tax=Solea senegalensis TaxID=28829 RepID=A0AAV6S193_SOLSE|nr:uncharacterized protein LOC122782996 [Solea senegalensis]KAG7511209.1 hypothetical protein JOB18_043674 [Solea senegalensis]